MFDTHIHTENSHDSVQTVDEICAFAIKNHISAVSLTDHAEVEIYDSETNFYTAEKAFKDVEYARSRYGDRLKIFAGIELGSYTADKNTAEALCGVGEFDIILGSVHSFLFGDKRIRFSKDNISRDASVQYLENVVDAYFSQVLSVAENADIDVLCHLTYPLRYINGKFKRNLSLHKSYDKLEKILKTLIERKIALEVNTAGINSEYGETLPSFELIEKYFSLGGDFITLGSDAHCPEKIANGFLQVKARLAEIGFDRYYYFEKRKPIPVYL